MASWDPSKGYVAGGNLRIVIHHTIRLNNHRDIWSLKIRLSTNGRTDHRRKTARVLTDQTLFFCENRQHKLICVHIGGHVDSTFSVLI